MVGHSQEYQVLKATLNLTNKINGIFHTIKRELPPFSLITEPRSHCTFVQVVQTNLYLKWPIKYSKNGQLAVS